MSAKISRLSADLRDYADLIGATDLKSVVNEADLFNRLELKFDCGCIRIERMFFQMPESP